MKKMLLAIVLMTGVCVKANAFDAYEVTRGTFNASSISISNSVPTLVSLARSSLTVAMDAYSVSLYNVSASSFVYTLSTSQLVSGAPVLTCANGIIVGSGTATAPTVLTEKFVGMYMWALACGNSAISDMRRAIRGY